MFYVYLLESLADKSWYIGFTNDLKDRFKRHNAGENKYTKTKKPWKLIYYEAYVSKKDALGREMFLKSGSGRRFLKNQLNDYLN